MNDLRSKSVNSQPAAPATPRKPTFLIILAVVAVCFALALLIAARDIIFGTTPQAPPPSSTAVVPAAVPDEPAKAASSSPEPAAATGTEVTSEPGDSVIDDDGKSLWTSPTEGKPLDLAYLPPGSQIIVALRPAALLKHPEGEKVVAALGPIGHSAVEQIERLAGLSLHEIDRLVIGCQPSSDGWQTTLVVYTSQPIDRGSLKAKFSSAAEKEYAGQKYTVANSLAYYQPAGKETHPLVVAPESSIGDIIDLAGQTPPLRRDIERLIEHTDSERHVTAIFAPNALFSDGSQLFSGGLARLRGPLFWFLGDELSGAALSLHWTNDDFFTELVATPTLETPPEKAAKIFAERVSQIPVSVESYVVTLNPQPYGKLLVARLPEMLRKLATYTRSTADRDFFILRAYLPTVAGHNLLLASELTLAEPPGSATVAASAMPSGVAAKTSPNSPANTAAEKLAKITSLKFARDTLESALDQLSQDIGAPIEIRGPDLQADGITKNQSFGIDVSNKPAAEILVEILRLANPDKSSPGPNDARQKLVYVVESSGDKTETIVVTTRARAAARKEELPAAFRSEKPSGRSPAGGRRTTR